MINSDACNKDIKVGMIKDRSTRLNNLKLVTYLMHPPPSFSPVLLRHSLPLAISQYYINHNTAPCPILQIPLVFSLSRCGPESEKEGGTAKGVALGSLLEKKEGRS